MNLQSLEDTVRNLRVQVNEQADLISTLRDQQNITNRTLQTLPVVGAPAIHNYIRNGDLSHSFDSYFHGAPVADDTRFECWDVYTHPAPSVGQQLKEDSVYSGVLVANSTALPDHGRSDAPTVDPYWNRSIGYALLGSTRTLDFPLPANVAYPGRFFFLMLIAAKRTVNVIVPGRLYGGIWDNTAGQRDFLNGNGFPITAEVVGLPVATTSTDYLVVLTSDSRKTVKSAVATVANAPSNASFISGQVYVRLTWPRFAGFTQADIYRKKGGIYALLARQSTVTQYFDQGDIQQTVGNYPDTDATQQKAIAYSKQGELDSFPVDGVDPAWRQYGLTIQIPPTYVQANTTDKQWLRVGWDAALTGSDAAHGMLVDMFGLSLTSGSWAHNSDDEKGLQNPIAAPSGSSQGGAGTGGSGFQPPDPGEGQERCISRKSLVWCVDDHLRRYTVFARELTESHRLLSLDGDRFVVGEIEHVSQGFVDRSYLVRTESGIQLRCSDSHRLITYVGDTVGTPVTRLQRGDPVVVGKLSKEKKIALYVEKVVSIRSRLRPCQIVIKIQMKKPGPPLYLAGLNLRGAIVSHNVKEL